MEPVQEAMDSEPDAIRLNSLKKSFDGLFAVDGLTFTVARGEIFGLVGPDGAGKTTTMRLLTAIMAPTSGDAWVAGRHIIKDAEAIKENIGYMSQRFGLYPDLTVLENIHFYADIYGVPRAGRSEKIEQLLAFCNLAPFKKRLARNLSGGMKQKLGLVCALSHTPKVLFLDEPTNGVDPVSRRDFWRILYQLLREKVTILITTAYLDEAERCNRIGLMHKGKLQAMGTPNEIKRLMQGTILEIHTSAPCQALYLLREELPTYSIELFGDRIHIVTQDLAGATQKTKELLKKPGFELIEIRSIGPTLEDVFVSMITPQKRGSGKR